MSRDQAPPARDGEVTAAVDDGRVRTPAAFRALLVALAVDNLGSGVFLPLTVIWLTHRVGLGLGTAGAVLAAGTAAGTVVPALAARHVDRLGARTLVAGSQVLQAAGMAAYLVAHGPVAALLGALLTAAGTQLFYSTLNTMTTDSLGGGRSDDAFARVGRVRGVAFAIGALLGGWLLSAPDPRALTAGVVLDLVSFLAAAAMLSVAVPAVRRRAAATPGEGEPSRVLADHRFLVLLATTFALMLTVGIFLLATPVYAHDRLGVPGWAVGAQVTVMTAVSLLLSTWVVRRTRHLARTTCLLLGGALFLGWLLLMAALPLVPPGGRTAALFAVVPLFCGGNLLLGPRLPALVGAVAPPSRRGAYFAYFQYAFTAEQLVSPLVTSLMGWRVAAPWLVCAAVVCLGLLGGGWLRRNLPAEAEAQG